MTEMQKTMAVFTGSVNPGLANGIASELGCELGNVKREKFANGEIYCRYGENLRGAAEVAQDSNRLSHRERLRYG